MCVRTVRCSQDACTIETKHSGQSATLLVDSLEISWRLSGDLLYDSASQAQAVAARVRRRGLGLLVRPGMGPQSEVAMQYRFADYTLDTQRYELWHAGVLCRIEPQVFDILAYLLAHRDRVVTRQELQEHVWPRRFISETTLDHRVMQARYAVGDDGRSQRVIQTIRGRGYRFIVAVQEHLPSLSDGVEQTVSRPEREPVLQSQSPTEPGARLLLPEGERKRVTVLFCDLANANSLAERLEPEERHAVLSRFFERSLHEVHRHDGTVAQLFSNGFMALFGAPMASEEHARQAVLAAVAIHRGLHQGSPGHGVALEVRLGLHTGLVIVGIIGADERRNYTVVGDAITLVTSLQQTAVPGTIQLTEATYEHVTGYFQCEDIGLVQVQGAAPPVRVYRVVGEREARSRLEVARQRGLTRFVGRERELSLLHACLARVQAGHGQVVGIIGEPGLGKSRLLYEFFTALEPGRVVWLEGHCAAHGQTIPYGPILEILRASFQIAAGDTLLQIRQKLHQGVCQLNADLQGILPFLEALCGLPGADEALRHLDPKDKRRRTFEALRAWIGAGGQRRPYVLVCENLHWIDRSSEDCLVALIEGLAALPVLVLTTHRPGYTVRWADKPSYTQLALEVLTAAEATATIATLLGHQAVSPALLQLMQEKTGGNPLFIEEVAHVLVEHGLLARQTNGLQGQGDVEVAFPATLEDIVRARLDGLEEPVKRTVQTAAVIGRTFDLQLLTRLSAPTVEVREALDTLLHLELIHEQRVFPELEYRFKHAVIHDVAYQSLLGSRRRELHGAIGRAMEELSPERLQGQAALLAYHYARSAYQDKAVAYALCAGDQAARLYAPAEAATYYTQALLQVQELPTSLEVQRTQIDAILKLAAVGTTQQELDRDQAHLERARPLAEALHDTPRLAQVLYWLGRIHYARGDLQAAIASAEQSLALADRLGDDTLAAPPVNLVGRIYYMRSDFVHASQMMVRSVEQMHRLGNTTEEATIAAFAGAALAYLGEFERAFQYATRGLHLAQELHNPFAEAAAYHYRGMLYDQYGDWPRALADYQEARRVAERVGDLFRIYIVQFWEGRAATMAGDPTRGRMLLEESLALAARLGTRFGLPCQKAFLAACLLALGERGTVLPLCHEAICIAAESSDHLSSSLAHRTLAEAVGSLHPADPQAAKHAIQEAIRLHQESANRPELARSYVSYARLLHGWGEAGRAQEHLARAIRLFRHLGMTWDLAQAAQAFKQRV